MKKEQVASLLKDKRHEMHLTGDEVVQKLKSYGINISAKTLWGYENCASSPSVPTFLALCKIYEVEDIISEAKAKPVTIPNVSQREQTLLEYFRAASAELQDAALRMLTPAEKESTASRAG